MLTITGTKSKSLTAYIERVYNYLYLHQSDAFVDVNLVPELPGNAGGYCDGDVDEINVDIARKDACGTISKKDLLINIAHEMVHAQQISSRMLENGGIVLVEDPSGNKKMTTKQIWGGKEYIGTPYADQPWEIEAYELENKVYEECK